VEIVKTAVRKLSAAGVFQPNTGLAKKLPKNSEVANILIGQVEFLTERVMTLCRLQSPTMQGDLSEVAIPTRFVFLLLVPADSLDEREIWHASEMARSLAILFSDKVQLSFIHCARCHNILVFSDLDLNVADQVR